MNIFDAHLRVHTKGFEDLQTLAPFGVRAVVSCAHDALPFSAASSVLNHFRRLLEWEPRRLTANGIQPYIALGLRPRAIPASGTEEVLALLPDLLAQEGVVVVGEIGLDRGTREEVKVFRRQLAIGRELGMLCVVHTPGRGRAGATEKALAIVAEVDIEPELVVIDHVNEETIAFVRASGVWTGLSLQPPKLSPERAAKLIRDLLG